MAQCEQCGTDCPESAGFCRQCGQELPARDALLGQEILGRYQVKRLVGEGGMGRVYEAEQRVGTTTRRVAVKTLRPQLSADPQLARRFFREAETIVRLTHPNSIQFFDFGELPNGMLAIVMEFIEGQTLSQELSHGVIEPTRAERILAQICGALAEAHSLGIVHRDLKPDNILLTNRAGQRDFVKVLDFGIAKISSADDDRSTKLTQQGMMVGTPPYMSPEQFSGDAIDARSDIYSLGVIAYEMLTGRLPFEARTPWEWASKHLTAEPAPIRVAAQPSVGDRRASAIRRALSKRPEQRQRDVSELLAEFAEHGGGDEHRSTASIATNPVQGSAVQAQGTPAHQESIILPTRRLSPWAWMAGAAAVGLIGGALVLASATRPESPVAQVATGSSLPPALPAPIAPLPQASSLPSPVPRAPEAVQRESGPSKAPEGQQATKRRSDTRALTRVETRGDAPVAAPPASSSLQQAVSPPTPVAQQLPRALPLPPRPAQSSSSGKPDPAAADLTARVEKALAAAPEHVEVAVGLYQAAAARYGEEQPALVPLRRALAENGAIRVREMLSAGRCAQAQALYRALNGIQAASDARRLFGQRCPAP